MSKYDVAHVLRKSLPSAIDVSKSARDGKKSSTIHRIIDVGPNSAEHASACAFYYAPPYANSWRASSAGQTKVHTPLSGQQSP